MIIRIQDRNVSTENILDIGEVMYDVNFTKLYISFIVNLINGESFNVEKVMEFKEIGIDKDSRSFTEYLASCDFMNFSSTARFIDLWEFHVALRKPSNWNSEKQNLMKFYEFVKDFFEEEIAVEVDKVKKVHQELLTLWNGDKSEIPTFKI